MEEWDLAALERGGLNHVSTAVQAALGDAVGEVRLRSLARVQSFTTTLERQTSHDMMLHIMITASFPTCRRVGLCKRARDILGCTTFKYCHVFPTPPSRLV